jgi:glutamate-1-semialdehyde 2,1-aminomutase
MTGFRVNLHGAQGLYQIKPDLTTLGKVIGGGLPVGAYGGRKDIMAMIAPSGPVYQAGTLSGNPLAMTAGIVTLQTLKSAGVWAALEASADRLVSGLGAAADRAGFSHQSTRVGTMFSMFFNGQPVKDWQSVKTSDTARFARYFTEMLKRGIYLAPSQFEAGFISTAHDEAVIEQTIHAAELALQTLQSEPAPGI